MGHFFAFKNRHETVYIDVMITKLLDENSHKFLTDKGFVARPLINDSMHIAYDYPGSVSIRLCKFNKITTDEKLYRVIVDQSYTDGRQKGKADAATAIKQEFNKIIFDQCVS